MILGPIVSRYELPDCKILNDKVASFLYSVKELQSKSDVVSNRKGWQRNDLQSMPQLQSLLTLIGKEFEKFVYETLEPRASCDFILGNLFCNINPPGAYHVPHIHEGDFTGVYYIKAPKDSGKLRLIYPHQCSSTARLQRLFKNIKLEERIEPEEGVGYFFPTYLNHYVEENLSDDDRISISYNINIKEK
jgi:uncharacterized protein (TIGR02466 family)